jgi:methionyl-tRNA synthetase
MKTETFACPCCGYKTFLHKPNGSFEICEVCFWEDDPVQLENPDYEGGANKISLKQGQKFFLIFGACEREMVTHVRKPSKEEQRDPHWKPFLGC